MIIYMINGEKIATCHLMTIEEDKRFHKALKKGWLIRYIDADNKPIMINPRNVAFISDSDFYGHRNKAQLDFEREEEAEFGNVLC